MSATIKELADECPDAVADAEFVEQGLREMSNFLDEVEDRTGVTLVGDRMSFRRARLEYPGLTRDRALYYFEKWQENILTKYPANT